MKEEIKITQEQSDALKEIWSQKSEYYFDKPTLTSATGDIGLINPTGFTLCGKPLLVAESPLIAKDIGTVLQMYFDKLEKLQINEINQKTKDDTKHLDDLN